MNNTSISYNPEPSVVYPAAHPNLDCPTNREKALSFAENEKMKKWFRENILFTASSFVAGSAEKYNKFYSENPKVWLKHKDKCITELAITLTKLKEAIKRNLSYSQPLEHISLEPLVLNKNLDSVAYLSDIRKKFEKAASQEDFFSTGVCLGESIAYSRYLLTHPRSTLQNALGLKLLEEDVVYDQMQQNIEIDVKLMINDVFSQIFDKKNSKRMNICSKEIYCRNFFENPKYIERARKINEIGENIINELFKKQYPPGINVHSLFLINPNDKDEQTSVLINAINNTTGKFCLHLTVPQHSILVHIDKIIEVHDSNIPFTEHMIYPNKETLINSLLNLIDAQYFELIRLTTIQLDQEPAEVELKEAMINMQNYLKKLNSISHRIASQHVRNFLKTMSEHIENINGFNRLVLDTETTLKHMNNALTYCETYKVSGSCIESGLKASEKIEALKLALRKYIDSCQKVSPSQKNEFLEKKEEKI